MALGLALALPYQAFTTGGGSGAAAVAYVKTATFGDSTANTKSWATTDFLDQSIADKQTTGATQTLSWTNSKWLTTRYYSPAQLEFNAGISGETTTQMLARSGLGAGPTRRSIEDTVAAVGSGGLIIARCGSVNDISGFTTGTSQATIDAVFTRHMQIINGLAAGGAYVLDEGIAGFDATAGVPPSAPNLAFIRAVVIELNGRYAAAIAALGNPKVRFLSPVGITCDSSGAFLPNVTTTADGTHLTNYGQEVLARAEAAVLSAMIGPAAPTAYPGTNLIATQAAYPNPSSQPFGQAPDTTYFQWGAAAGNRQNAVIESINGVPYATCELAATGASASLQFFALLVPLAITPAFIAAGDLVVIEADFIANAVTGTFAPAGISSRVQLGVSGTDRIIYDTATALTPVANPLTSINGKISTGKIRMPTSTATLTSANTFLLITVNANNGETVRIRVGNCRILKV